MSKTYTVTEEFLQEAYREACTRCKQKLETEFHEACLGDFKPGRWYKRKDNLQFQRNIELARYYKQEALRRYIKNWEKIEKW